MMAKVKSIEEKSTRAYTYWKSRYAVFFGEFLVIQHKAKYILQRCNGSEEMEREEGRNSNIEGTDTIGGGECDIVVNGDGA